MTKNKTSWIRCICFVTAMLATTLSYGQSAENAEDLTLSENIEIPKVAAKALKPIQNHFREIKESLDKHGLNATLLRNDDVIMVSLPCSLLFAPNETSIKESGMKYLRAFSDLLKYPTMYKVLVAVHSDNTGEPEYNDALTAQRAISIEDFLEKDARVKDINLIPYGIGEDEPLTENNSIENRAKNRRVEIYVVPEWQMIEVSRSGKLK